MNLPGIGADRDERRDVPGADLAANLIGFTGDDHTGLEGLEARYDELLRGTDGKRVFEIGNPGEGRLAKEIPGGYHRQTAGPARHVAAADHRPRPAVRGAADARRADGEVERHRSAAAVVLDVRTGEVLAQASYPAYNAAKPLDFKPVDREDVREQRRSPTRARRTRRSSSAPRCRRASSRPTRRWSSARR